MTLDKRIQGVLNSKPEKRIKFTINRFCDSGEIFLLQSKLDNGFVKYLDSDDNILFPIFPEFRFAKLYQQEEWLDTYISKFDIEEFFYELVPFLTKNNINFSVFPSLNFDELNIQNPIYFAKQVQKVLKDSYGEIYELNYF